VISSLQRLLPTQNTIQWMYIHALSRIQTR
jgi:hypothetical protein